MNVYNEGMYKKGMFNNFTFLGKKPSYLIKKYSDILFKIKNPQSGGLYTIERKPVKFKSGKTYKIWTCTCPSYVKWGWKNKTCKHIDLLRDLKDIQ